MSIPNVRTIVLKSDSSAFLIDVLGCFLFVFVRITFVAFVAAIFRVLLKISQFCDILGGTPEEFGWLFWA